MATPRASLLMAEDAKWQGLLGENLAAQHYVKQSGVDVEHFAQRFLDEWMKSQPHRDNLAFADYDRTGVGAAVNGDTVYVAQLFACDLGIKADRDPNSAVTEFPSAEAACAAAPRPVRKTAGRPLRLRGAESGTDCLAKLRGRERNRMGSLSARLTTPLSAEGPKTLCMTCDALQARPATAPR